MRPSHDISTISRRYSLPPNSRILEIQVVISTFTDLRENEDLYPKPTKGVMKAAAYRAPPGYYTPAAEAAAMNPGA